jgi:purine-binding chemotaxis protein CheW
LNWVVEIMRPLPIEPVAGMPAYVLGLSIVRGYPAPVIHLSALLQGQPAGAITRMVAVRSGERRLLLAVESVRGVERIERVVVDRLPALVEKSSPDAIAAIGNLDQQLYLLLRETRVISEDVEALLVGPEGSA